MMYQSTRDASHKKYSAAEVIKMGLAPDGGLFIPESIPALTTEEIAADSVILSVGYNPAPVATKGVHVIGDAKAVGNLRTVIWGAWDVAMKL